MRAIEPTRVGASGAVPGDSQGGRLFVGGIPYQATKKELVKHFSTFGAIRAINLSKSESDPALNKGFGFVIYQNPMDALRVLEHRKNHVIRSKAVASAAGRQTRRHRSVRHSSVGSPGALSRPT